MVVNVWLECIDASPKEYHCVLAIGDNTSAIGWLYRTSRIEIALRAHEAHHRAARKLAELVLENEIRIASKHIKGEIDIVADFLSFAGTNERGKPHPYAYDYPKDEELTKLLLLILPSQVPANFKICNLPSEILSWVASTLQIAVSSLTRAKRDATKPPADCGGVGQVTVNTSEWEVTLPHCFISRGKGCHHQILPPVYRTSRWERNGAVAAGTRANSVVGNTVRQAASHLAAAFWDNNVASPLHVQGSQNLLPFARSLFRAFDNRDPRKTGKKQ